jgi:hypothetical protein
VQFLSETDGCCSAAALACHVHIQCVCIFMVQFEVLIFYNS